MIGMVVWLYWKKRLGIGSVATTVMVVSYVMSIMTDLSRELSPMVTNISILRQVDKFLAKEERETIEDPEGRGSFSKGDLRLDKISYKTDQGDQLFKDFSLYLSPGSSLLLSGDIGSGKTTLLSLIQGEILPGSGVITLDGQDIGKVCAKDLSSAMVSTPPPKPLFSSTELPLRTLSILART
jgi:ABC-type multidrug transport system fused ATPase/permease subunit